VEIVHTQVSEYCVRSGTVYRTRSYRIQTRCTAHSELDITAHPELDVSAHLAVTDMLVLVR